VLAQVLARRFCQEYGLERNALRIVNVKLFLSKPFSEQSFIMSEEEGQWRLLNPLSIRFSQPRIAPHYRDGHLIDETTAEVSDMPIEVTGATVANPTDAASGTPPYDVVLVPPFPGIRIISWLPKLRRPDGEAERDEYGDQKLGKRAWFALDNRRLYSLQCAAAKRWPKRCCAVVRCIEEVPGSTIRELRKFRTTTEGRCVDIGVRVGETQNWCWKEVAPPAAAEAQMEAEGLFAEDLWDAGQWAPRALELASGSSLASKKEPAVAASAVATGPVGAAAPAVRGGSGDSGYAPRREAAAPAVATATISRGGSGEGGYPPRKDGLTGCPGTGWQYVDPSNNVQGPFPLAKMRLWHQHGFFYPKLPMRCDPSDAFMPFCELFPEGVEPFRDLVLRREATEPHKAA